MRPNRQNSICRTINLWNVSNKSSEIEEKMMIKSFDNKHKYEAPTLEQLHVETCHIDEESAHM